MKCYAALMETSKWELIVDTRLKYGNGDPKFYKVSIIKPSENFPQKVQLNNYECVLAARFLDYSPFITNYNDVRSNDIWISTYPRSGTTLTQEMVWLINNDCDFQKARNFSLLQRSPVLRDLIHAQNQISSENDELISKNDIKHFSNFPHPHHIKNHLPAAFLPNEIWTVKPKIIYVARNPKDTAISFYHYYKNVYKYTGTMEEFLNLFLEESIEFGSQTRHILDFWNLRNEENILFLTFEEMMNDLKKVLETVATFLGKSLTQTQLKELNDYLQFSSMRERADEIFSGSSILKNPKLQFFRKGKTGSYKNEMNEEIIQRFDEVIDRDLTANGCDIYA